MGINNHNTTALFPIAAILVLLLVLLSSFSSPSVTTMAQQITAPPPPPTSSVTTGQTTSPIPPLTPEEQEQQTRLQNVIAATNQNLNETEKQIDGIVYTPRWSEPVWVEPGALSILIAYCLPGEFAESGQEILGGFELEVLESYEIALPQNFLAWMMVVGNEDEQNRRLPAAVGVICASDINQADTRTLSPQEQQQINNVISQFTTQVTNIDQVINIINNVTTPQNDTGGGMTPPPPANDTEPTTEEQPLRVEIIADTTHAFASADEPAFIRLDANITGGTPPYRLPIWDDPNGGRFVSSYHVAILSSPRTHTFFVIVEDNTGSRALDDIQITIEERPPEGGEVLLPPETGGEGQPPGGGLLPGIAPGEGTPPPPDDTGGGGEEEGTPPPSSTTEETPGDDTGGGEEEQPVTEEEEAATSPPPANDGGG